MATTLSSQNNKLLCALLSLYLSSCASVSTSPSLFTDLPTITPNPTGSVPLSAEIRFDTTEPVTTTLHISDGQTQWDTTFDSNRYNPHTGLPVIGLQAAHNYSIQVSVRNAAGVEITAPQTLAIKTPPLPTDPYLFPALKTTFSKTDKVEPGITLVSIRRRMVGNNYDLKNQTINKNFGLLAALNNAGQVIWYYQSDKRIADFDYLPNGHFLFLTADHQLNEIDVLGHPIASWYSTGTGIKKQGIPIETMAMHHGIQALPSGNFLVQGAQTKAIDNYYTSETDPKAPRKRQEKVVGDELIEFQPDGKIVWRWNTFDYLDPFRIGYATFDGYWNKRGFTNTVDWTHSNAHLYNPQDNSILLSLRHQDAVIKIDRASSEIKWIFAANARGWPVALQKKLLKFDSNTRPPYHQHGLSLTPQGTLLLFNNDGYHALPFDPALPPSALESRALEYQIDEKNFTIKEVWSSDIANEAKKLSVAMGSTEMLPKTGHVFVGFGGLLPQDKMKEITWDNIEKFRGWALIREYTHTTPTRVVWETVIDNQSKDVPLEWVMFSARKIAHW